MLQYFRKSGLEQLLKKHLGNKTGEILRDMITLQLLDTGSKLSYVKKRQNTLNYLLGGKQMYSEDVF